ncbi:MAG: hypothetical protein ACYCPS_02485 [Candidatus Saccharimonadales bacterium]
MFEKFKPVAAILTLGVGSVCLNACSNSSTESAAKTTPSTTTSSVPPVAVPGNKFSCIIDSKLRPLDQAGLSQAAVNSASQILSSLFNESKSQILSDASYVIGYCQRSITAAIANTSGIVVSVPSERQDTCITWTALYGNVQQAQAGGPTNHIGMICVPRPLA